MTVCQQCTAEFEGRDSRSKFCSPECRKEVHRTCSTESKRRVGRIRAWGDTYANGGTEYDRYMKKEILW